MSESVASRRPDGRQYGSLRGTLSARTARVGVVGLGYVGLPLAVEFARAGFDDDRHRSRPAQGRRDQPGHVVHPRRADRRGRAAGRRRPAARDDRLRGASPSSTRSTSACRRRCARRRTPTCRTSCRRSSRSRSTCTRAARHPRVHDLSGHDRGARAADARGERAEGRRRLLPRLLARARRSGQPDVQHAQRAEGGRRRRPGLAPSWPSTLYGAAIDTIVPVSSPQVAEMVKLLENTFRAVNIGLVNEIALMCDRLGIDVWEVVDAAATKPFGFMPFYPGPGLGGHCIPIDPFYLSWKAKQTGFEPRFIELAGQINGGDAALRRRQDRRRAEPPREVGQRLDRARPRHRLQARHRRHPRVAGARRDGAAAPEGREGPLRGSVRADAGGARVARRLRPADRAADAGGDRRRRLRRDPDRTPHRRLRHGAAARRGSSSTPGTRSPASTRTCSSWARRRRR